MLNASTIKRRNALATLERDPRSTPQAWRLTLYPFRLDVRPVEKPRFYHVRSQSRRGTIQRFTAASRRRLLRFMASVATSMPLFATLTYPFPVDASTVKRDIHRFSKSFRRRFPKAWYVWRIERTKRGRWHIHMIISGVVFWHWQDLAHVWYRSIGAKNPRWIGTMTDISRVKSKRALMGYVGKYLGKINGRDDSLNPETGEIEDVGRFWGVVGRDNVEYLSVELFLPYPRYMAFRRIIKRLYRYSLPTLTRRSFWHSGSDSILRWLRYSTGNHYLELIISSP